MGELTLFSQIGKKLFIFCLLFSFTAQASFIDYKVETNASISPFTVKVEGQKNSFTAKIRAFKIDKTGRVISQEVSKSFYKDDLNPPLYWEKKTPDLQPKSLISWANFKNNKHIICLAAIDEYGYLTLSYYDEISPQHFKLTILSDPYLALKQANENDIQAYHANYVGRGEVAHLDAEGPMNKERDIDFAIKEYSRGFELIKSLIICPEGRDYCTDGKKKNNKYYYKKIKDNFFVEEEKGSMFKTAVPFTLQQTGHLQYALWHKGFLRTYTLNYSPEHPLILEYASWTFKENDGLYSYAKYIDAKLNKTVKGTFFKAKDDEQYTPQTRQ